MYIKKVTIKNFQSHKNTILNLHNGVNVIIGKSDCGKSAILRSLGWCIRNRSEDRGFRSNWGGKTDVELVFTDGKEISRVQEKDNAYYLLDPENNVDEEYKAFKANIPEDVVTALNLNDINIQSQFDPPFLLSDSAGDVAKTLNKVANLVDIDTSISNIRKLVLANSTEIRQLEGSITECTEQLEALNYLDSMEKDVVQYESLVKQDKELDQDHFVLSLLLSNVAKHSSSIKEIDSFLKVEQDYNVVLTLTEQNKAVTNELNAIENILKAISKANVTIDETKTFLMVEKDADLVSELFTKLSNIEKGSTELQTQITCIQLQEGKVRTLNKNLDSYTMEFEALMPNQCPLCGK